MEFLVSFWNDEGHGGKLPKEAVIAFLIANEIRGVIVVFSVLDYMPLA